MRFLNIRGHTVLKISRSKSNEDPNVSPFQRNFEIMFMIKEEIEFIQLLTFRDLILFLCLKNICHLHLVRQTFLFLKIILYPVDTKSSLQIINTFKPQTTISMENLQTLITASDLKRSKSLPYRRKRIKPAKTAELGVFLKGKS